MKTIFVSDLKVNDNICDIFAVASKGSISQYKSKSGDWFSLILSDKTGTITTKFWGNDENHTLEVYNSFNVGEFVSITGTVTEYLGKSEISIDSKMDNPIVKWNDDAINLDDFLKKSSKDIPQMIGELRNIVSEIQNPSIKQLLESFTDDNVFMEKKYSQAPAGKKLHHNFVGGLLEHVLSLVSLSITLQKSHPELNRDLLITACILHDIGKVEEYDMGASIQITDKGRLFGHVSIGFLMVAERISQIHNFPEDLKLRILHIILSHHQKLEHGSPVTPMIPEAIAFAMIDDTDAKSQHIIQLVEESTKDWEFEKEFSGKYNWMKPMNNNE